jgi:hypothetical protein
MRMRRTHRSLFFSHQPTTPNDVRTCAYGRQTSLPASTMTRAFREFAPDFENLDDGLDRRLALRDQTDARRAWLLSRPVVGRPSVEARAGGLAIRALDSGAGAIPKTPDAGPQTGRHVPDQETLSPPGDGTIYTFWFEVGTTSGTPDRTPPMDDGFPWASVRASGAAARRAKAPQVWLRPQVP